MKNLSAQRQRLLMILAAVGIGLLVLDSLVGLAEKRLMKWQPRSGETEKL